VDLAKQVLGEERTREFLSDLELANSVPESSADACFEEPKASEPRKFETKDLGSPTSTQVSRLIRSRHLKPQGALETLESLGARRLSVRWSGDGGSWGPWREGVGFPTLAGGWKVWGLDAEGRCDLDDHRKFRRRNVGEVSIVPSPEPGAEDAVRAVERLWDVEGESDLLAALQAGLEHVVSSTGGATSLAGHERHEEVLLGLHPREVVVVRDLDAAGRNGGEKVAAWWLKRGVSVRVLALPEHLGDGGDLRDYLNAVGSVEDLEELADAAELRGPSEKTAREASRQPEDETYRVYGEYRVGVTQARWPDPIAPAAYSGLAGEIVQAIEPETEADPAAILLQLLAGFGNALGRSAHFRVEGDLHYANLFALLVGDSATARKGTSWGIVRNHLLLPADEDWARSRIAAGMSSGEGLIYHVRDPIEKMEEIKKNGRRTGEMETFVADAGVSDKRLLVVETEFASVLRKIERQGNSLSAVVRQAWDSGDLGSLTKNEPARAIGAHVSIVGHITQDELRRYLTRTETGNGFANRFLFACVTRSKLLPEGGRLADVDLGSAISRLQAALEIGRSAGELVRDEEARALWRDIYPELSRPRPGLLGTAISRRDAQVVRLSLIYALLDASSVIRRKHLEAALAVCRYCAASAAFIFGHSTGDQVADEVREALRNCQEGMTRTEIRDHFNRNKSSDEISHALSLLQTHGLAHCETEPTGGRSAERWYAVDAVYAKGPPSSESAPRSRAHAAPVEYSL
jgi:hypothetical protein